VTASSVEALLSASGLSLLSGGEWSVRVASPPFVDGTEVVVSFTGSGHGLPVYVDGPRARGTRSSLSRVDETVARERLVALLSSGWSVAPPWHEEDDVTEWLIRRIGRSTLYPSSTEQVVDVIERERLVRWVEAERLVDRVRVARALRLDRVALWREGIGSRFAWAFASISSTEETRLLARVDVS